MASQLADLEAQSTTTGLWSTIGGCVIPMSEYDPDTIHATLKHCYDQLRTVAAPIIDGWPPAVVVTALTCLAVGVFTESGVSLSETANWLRELAAQVESGKLSVFLN
ncbi:MAG TPA: hypothetical protein VGJ20_30300 [Xanthobacteraceae bacterium]|jgi:hypothetical protein